MEILPFPVSHVAPLQIPTTYHPTKYRICITAHALWNQACVCVCVRACERPCQGKGTNREAAGDDYWAVKHAEMSSREGTCGRTMSGLLFFSPSSICSWNLAPWFIELAFRALRGRAGPGSITQDSGCLQPFFSFFPGACCCRVFSFDSSFPEIRSE